MEKECRELEEEMLEGGLRGEVSKGTTFHPLIHDN
jgi:hypothetical protein